MEIFAENLRVRIASLGLSHAEVARRCELEIRRFHHYVVGDREPDLQTLVRIAEVLDTTPDALLSVKQAGDRADGEEARLRARLSAAAKSLNANDLRLLAILADGVISFSREVRSTPGTDRTRPASRSRRR